MTMTGLIRIQTAMSAAKRFIAPFHKRRILLAKAPRVAIVIMPRSSLGLALSGQQITMEGTPTCWENHPTLERSV